MTPLDMALPTSKAIPSRPVMTADKEAAHKAAEEFEQVFLTTYLEQMFSGVKTEAPFGGGTGEEIFRSMLLNEYSTEMSKSGGIGLADYVYREILTLQEVQ
jgi:Rod binding domain-containing protein